MATNSVSSKFADMKSSCRNNGNKRGHFLHFPDLLNNSKSIVFSLLDAKAPESVLLARIPLNIYGP
jgi:hypothetical protein